METVSIKGWVRTRRDSRTFSFIELNDGSCLNNIQVIADDQLENYEQIKKISTGSSVGITGTMRESPGKGQKWEIHAGKIEIINIAPDDYPLQKKRHTDEFLRTISHLRPRTNKYGAAFRIRSRLSYAIHSYFQDLGFTYIHTPILTGSDCEGAGELFRVSTLEFMNRDAPVDFSEDFFGEETFLTVSGQLNVESYCLALKNVYTFGPTFRAENSNTSRHLAEFWMIEPEMAFADLNDNADLAEEYVQYLVRYVLDHCDDDLAFFNKWVEEGIVDHLEFVADSEFERITYTEAIDVLEKSGETFEYPVAWGSDLQSEHERYLAEHLQRPVVVMNYPEDIKAFYMRRNDDGKTVAAMDVLAPGIGEIIGGSQREERLEVLEARMLETGMDKDPYWWYLESRKFGTVPHSGFGLGFERLLMLVTGISNIRDVIPFPRTPNNLDF